MDKLASLNNKYLKKIDHISNFKFLLVILFQKHDKTKNTIVKTYNIDNI